MIKVGKLKIKFIKKETKTVTYFWKCLDCTESGLHMFKDAVDEFYRCLLEKVNQVVAADGKDVNVSE